MTDIDIEQIVAAMLRDALLIGCASASQLAPNREWLIDIRKEVDAAIAKTERIAA